MNAASTCYACGRSLTNDPALSNCAKWTYGGQAYCAYDAWCETYTLKAEVGERYMCLSDQESQHIRASVDDWFADHACDWRCAYLNDTGFPLDGGAA